MAGAGTQLWVGVLGQSGGGRAQSPDPSGVGGRRAAGQEVTGAGPKSKATAVIANGLFQAPTGRFLHEPR